MIKDIGKEDSKHFIFKPARHETTVVSRNTFGDEFATYSGISILMKTSIAHNVRENRFLKSE